MLNGAGDDDDDDFFTPITSTSLANIFDRTEKYNVENSSLKYVPQKPVTEATKPEETKIYENIYACTVYAYEFNNNVYTDKGKLGFAIMKNTTTGISRMLLYNSNKVTLSSTTIQPSLNVSLKLGKYLSFYDDSKIYWALSLTSEEFTKTTNILENIYNVKISQTSIQNPAANEDPANPSTIEQLSNMGSDTESLHRKSKSSIVTRMANMGYSVLPTQSTCNNNSSSSSEKSESSDHQKLRHKIKIKLPKKGQDIDSIECINSTKSENRLTVSKMESKSEDIPSIISNQVLPLSSANIYSTAPNQNDAYSLMAEQRINNSEIRSNIGRLSDKIDQIFQSIIQKENKNDSNYPNEIYQKLLSEYEKKIKMYEQFILSKGFSILDTTVNFKQISNDMAITDQTHTEIEMQKKQILLLQNMIMSKDIEIIQLKNEIEKVKPELSEKNKKLKKDNDNILRNIEENKFQKEAAHREEEKLINLEKEDATSSSENLIIVKNVLNDSYQSIIASFENDQTYSGSAIKQNVLSVLRNIASSLLIERNQ